jgi:hypothetical protein
MEGARGFECLLEVLRVYAPSVGLKLGSAVSHGYHLLCMVLSILGPLVTVTLGQGEVITTVSTTEVANDPGFATEVGLDGLLAGGILGGDIQELLH